MAPMVMGCRYAIATAGLLSLHLCRLFQARLTPADRSRSSLVTQSCFSSFEWMVLCSLAPEPESRCVTASNLLMRRMCPCAVTRRLALLRRSKLHTTIHSKELKHDC